MDFIRRLFGRTPTYPNTSDDVIILILQYLSPTEYVRFAGVCAQWRSVALAYIEKYVRPDMPSEFLYSPVAIRFHDYTPCLETIIRAGAKKNPEFIRNMIQRWAPHRVQNEMGYTIRYSCMAKCWPKNTLVIFDELLKFDKTGEFLKETRHVHTVHIDTIVRQIFITKIAVEDLPGQYKEYINAATMTLWGGCHPDIFAKLFKRLPPAEREIVMLALCARKVGGEKLIKKMVEKMTYKTSYNFVKAAVAAM